MLTEAERRAVLAARLRAGKERDAGQAGSRGIPRRPAGLTSLPLSFGQEQLWFVDQFAPGLPTYNITFALRLTGPLDQAALGRALDGLAVRHEALRSRLLAGPDGRPVQLIDPPRPQKVELVDLSGLESDRRQASLREFIDARSVEPFTLAEGPLLRTWLLRVAEQGHVLLVVVHHTVFDAWSINVFAAEVAALYQQEASGEPSGLADLPVQYPDYALWERQRLTGSVLDELEDYWRGVLTGFETVPFPTDRPRPIMDSFEGGMIGQLMDRELLDGLRDLSRSERTTLFVTLTAALQALLHRYTGQTDIVIGTASANRGRKDLAPLIGFLVNTLPIRADLSGDPSFSELMARTRDATTAAYAHQDLPFGKLVETLQVDRDPSRAPVFQIAMTYNESGGDATLSAAGLDIVIAGADLAVDFNAAKFDLDFGAESRSDGLWFECSYKTALFDEATVRRLIGNFEELLRGIVADPSARLSQLPLLTETELYAELIEWNDTAVDLPVICIHEGFEAQVARAPDAVAAQYEDQQWSYAQLNARANQVARRLRDLGVGPERLAGVCLPASLDRLAALLGVWKAGGGYVPLDAALPADRLAFMIGDTGMGVVLTDAASVPGVPAVDGVTVLDLDGQAAAIAGLDDGNLDGTGVTPSNLAYVIYTSGSTGEPKGVVVEHRQAVNFLQGLAKPWRIGPGSAVLNFAAFTFDVSVSDMFTTLLAGGKVVLAAADTLHSPPQLAALIRDAGVSYACLPPAVLSLLTGEEFPSLRTLVSSGEELSSELLLAWLGKSEQMEIFNGYGPTEASMGATFMRMEAGTQLPPPIGRPKPNYRVYVLDQALNPVPVGVIGELHIGGPGVARGYLNRPELTEQKFIADLFAGPGEHGGEQPRLYKTGDLVKRRPDGSIGFVGRIDDQVKIRGLRVELGEIETVLVAHPAVAQAVVTVVTDPAGEKQLAGYLRPEPGGAIDISQIRQHLAFALPAYMIPDYLTVIEEFPLNASGKIDKAALPTPEAQSQAAYVEPATLIETVLADMFAGLLGCEQVSVTDSFFDLGGNSIQAMRLVSMLDDELEVDVGVAAMFLAPTPRQLAALLRDRHSLEDADLSEEGLEDLDDEVPD